MCSSDLWEIQGFGGFSSIAAWPEFDVSKTIDSEKEIAVQINGKLKGTIMAATDIEDALLLEAIAGDERFEKHINGKEVVKSIVVKNKLVNLVVK